ncbi:MFS general substrate transporter [Periconia macrospinosa]|uniref:MFS general substrate transporter n=1 Tax=Periconia macrospinosa TaxID=97972 RepID=A0A2V1D3T7_9PLEO|nr:MFS general substrate transporter [Periconia macrospinosa]
MASKELPSEAELAAAQDGAQASTCETKGKVSQTSQTRSDHSPEEKPPVVRLFTLVLGMALALFICAFDGSVIPTLLPTLAKDFKTVQDTGWYGSAFLFAMGAAQPALGKIYGEFSVRITYVVSAVIFAVGSILCALSKSSGMFIASRALAGLGSGGMTTGTTIISYHVLPERLFPLCNGLVGAFEASATIVGPIIGGTMADGIGWEWVFWINLPVSAIAITLVVVLYPGLKRFDHAPMNPNSPASTMREKFERLELVGGILLAGSILMLLFGVHDAGGSSTARTIGLLVGSGVLLLITVCHQHFLKDKATYPTRLFLNRYFVAPLLYGFFMKGSEAVVYYLLPVWFQTVKCSSAGTAAVQLLPSLIALIVASIITGIGASATRRIAPFMVTGAVIASAGALLLHYLDPDAGSPKWIGYQVAYGFGCGIGLQLSLVGVQTALNAKDVPFGSSVAILSRILGSAIFIFVGQKVYLDRLGTLANADELSPCESVVPSQLRAVLSTYNEATAKGMIVAVVLIFAAIPSAIGVNWARLESSKSQSAEKDDSESGSASK